MQPRGAPMPRRIPLQSPLRNLRVEWNHISNSEYTDIGEGDWIVWLTANGDFTLGSFLKLCYDGKMYLCTLHPDGTESQTEIEK